MCSARRTQHIITPCRTRSRLIQSLEEFGYNLSAAELIGFDNLQLRAKDREQAIRARHQANLERIIQLTLERSDRVTTITQPDSDWLERFLELAKRTSHTRMQELWSRVLLMESQSPGRFSVRALNVLAELTPYEAVILRKAKAFTAYEKRVARHKIIIGYQQRPRFLKVLFKTNMKQLNLSKCGLNYPDILTLVDLGILHAEMIESGFLPAKKGITLSLANQRIVLTPLQQDLVLTYFRFTPIGEELCRLINATFSEMYWEELEQSFAGKFLLHKEEN